MNALSYIVPRTVKRASTSYNRDIRVVEENGKYKLLVNGSRQSGEYIKELWQKACAEFGIITSPDVKSILVLGVAGGTVIHLLRGIYPDAEITGVDIDKTMIEIGKKYFGLSGVPGLTLRTEDAKVFMKKNTHWDMVVIDLFIGAAIPPFVGEDEFLSDVKNSLTPNGKLLINYLYELEYKQLSDLFIVILRKLFSNAADYKIYNNRFFYVVKYAHGDV